MARIADTEIERLKNEVSVERLIESSGTTAAFFIRIDTMTGIDSVTGTGVVAASSVEQSVGKG